MKIPHFQRVIAIFCFATLIAACGNDDPAREAATQQAVAETTQATTTTDPAAAPTDAQAAQAQQQAQEQQQQQQNPATNPKQARPKTAGTLNLGISGGSAAKGEVTCVAVTAKNFKSVVSMQYTLKWDPKVLRFKEVKGFTLPGLNTDSFGKHILDKGLMTHSWYDANVKGINKGDGETLYEICFEAIGTAGSKSAIQIVDAPTIIELANANSEFFTLDATPGTVLVK
ncbi:MAG: hypothetical protein IT258_03155 [Saprospiraceae bacterium]|nr:hypothetical protein [Saprospiraceae bacterium]